MNDILEAQKPLVSIIVPVYKAEDFLPKCLDSILAQSETCFELLLIDDGSPDGCPALCDAYAAQDPRVRVVHKPNGGVSSARNEGLDRAQGKFIVFIDSDDFVDADYLERMLALQKEAADDRVLIVTDYQPFAPNGAEKRDFPQPFTIRLSGPPASPQAFRDLIFGFRLFPPYCKLYCRSIIEKHQLRFNPSIRTAEDFDYNMRYIAQIDTVRYDPTPFYHYRVDYKKYRPSNHGVLGDSEIKSVHIMANGITGFAKRMGVYDTVEQEIYCWAAKKHYFNRLPMLFAPSDAVSKAERRSLYRRLIDDTVYRTAYKRGIRLLSASTTRTIGCRADCFEMWYLFYAMQKLRRTKKQ